MFKWCYQGYHFRLKGATKDTTSQNIQKRPCTALGVIHSIMEATGPPNSYLKPNRALSLGSSPFSNFSWFRTSYFSAVPLLYLQHEKWTFNFSHFFPSFSFQALDLLGWRTLWTNFNPWSSCFKSPPSSTKYESKLSSLLSAIFFLILSLFFECSLELFSRENPESLYYPWTRTEHNISATTISVPDTKYYLHILCIPF